jgi:hypothetical protein
VPPTRDEESETQRKAHAKRVRETRRSTQGVTLDEIKSAEQLVKMKNANNNTANSSSENVSRFIIFYFCGIDEDFPGYCSIQIKGKFSLILFSNQTSNR